MMKRNVYDYYGLLIKETFITGRYTGFHTEDSSYLLIPDSLKDEEEWKEKLEWAAYMEHERLEQPVAIFIPPLSGRYSAPIDGEKQLLFQIPDHYKMRETEEQEDGSLLGRFHHRTSNFFQPALPHSFADRWSYWWEIRLNQLENWYGRVKEKTTYSALDKWFLQSFPYYIGRVENAIQWLRETSWDAQEREKGCVTHFCFTPRTWVMMEENCPPVILPSDWQYDHPVRDVSEWLRHAIEEDLSKEVMMDFLKNYEAKQIINPVGWKLLFGRLLFPFSYMEQIEQMYLRETTAQAEEASDALYHLWEHEKVYMEKVSFILQHLVPDWETGPEWIIKSS